MTVLPSALATTAACDTVATVVSLEVQKKLPGLVIVLSMSFAQFSPGMLRSPLE